MSQQAFREGRSAREGRLKTFHINLNKEITGLGSGSARELCDLIEKRVAEYSPINLATAIRRLLMAGRAGVHRETVARALHKLEVSAMNQIADFQSLQCSQVLYIYAKKRQRPENHQFLSTIDARVEEVAWQCDDQAVSNILWAYATTGRRPGERVLGALEERVEEVTRYCSTQSVSNILWAFATMRRRGTG